MAKKFDYQRIQGVAGNPNVTAEFIKGVEKMAERLAAKPEHILAAMSFETGGSFSPSIQNSIGATGLIQFLPATARSLGTTTDDLKRMTAAEQLTFVEKYMEPAKNRLGTLGAVYTTILAGAPKAPDAVLFRAGTPAYKLNPLDWDGDGRITAAEAATIPAAHLFGGVRAVQQRLLDLKLVPADVTEGFADGRWGRNTSRVLAEFQKAKKLAPTGLLDEATGAALFSGPGKKSESSVLKKGATGAAVRKMQNDFFQLGLLDPARLGAGLGKFEAQTQRAVKTFQKILNFAATGEFGEAERLATEAILAGVRRGSRNATVVESIQDRLVALDYMTRAQVDTGYGRFGGQTEAAVKRFQKDRGLQESGVVEAAGFKALFVAAPPGAPAREDYFPARDGEHYSVLSGVLMTLPLQAKVEKIAALYFAEKGAKLVVTSGYRPAERQAPAMYRKIADEGAASVRNLYKNKAAVDEILDAYRAHQQSSEAAVEAIRRTIERQIGRGVFISNHLLSDAIDVRLTANLKALKDAVIAVGGRVVVESNHFHLELH